MLTLVALPLLAALALPAAFAGGGTRRWFGGRSEGQRAEAQAAKDAAAAAFYELDTAQRDLRISIETITAVDDSPAARRVVSDFEALGRRIDEASQKYITAVDAHDLDRDELEASVAARARGELVTAKDELVRVKADLDRFEQSLGPLLGKAETQLARLAPAVERARQALLGASNALDSVRQSGLKADDLAARLAALGPELTKLNRGAGQHGVPETLERAERVSREAAAVRSEAERLPEHAAEIDHRLVSLRTRAQALTTRAGQVEPVLSELRRRFSAACWQDLQHVPEQAAENVRQAETKLKEARAAREAQRWPDATSLLATVRALLNSTDEAVSAAGDRLQPAERRAEGSPAGDRPHPVRDPGRAAAGHGGPYDSRPQAGPPARRLGHPARPGCRHAGGPAPGLLALPDRDGGGAADGGARRRGDPRATRRRLRPAGNRVHGLRAQTPARSPQTPGADSRPQTPSATR